jgi:hypothetical protein
MNSVMSIKLSRYFSKEMACVFDVLVASQNLTEIEICSKSAGLKVHRLVTVAVCES